MLKLVRYGLTPLRSRLDNQRGAAMVIVAGSMIALISAVALAVDVGLMTVTRTEAQQVADGAALAGAGALVMSPSNAAFAIAEAIEFSSQNKIQGTAAVVLPEDINVDINNSRVTVQVLRTRDRGNPVSTFFASVFGVNTVNIRARATAEASPALDINCLLPVAMPDRWFEAPTAGNDPDAFDPEDGDVYVPWMDMSTDPPTYNHEAYTGYSADDIGTQFVMMSSGGGGSMNPSWYFPWRPPGEFGASDFQASIAGCVDPAYELGVGSEVDAEPGSMTGPAMDGFQELIDLDPNAVWNGQLNCVTDAANVLSSNGNHCRSSPRVRAMPMFDPTESPLNGSHPFRFSNFTGVFVQGIQGNDVVARWTGYIATNPASLGFAASQQFRALQLIE